MEAHQILFLSAEPDVADGTYFVTLAEFFRINWRNVALLVVSFIALAVLTARALRWVTQDFSDWQSTTAVGWSVVAALAISSLLALWRLIDEEGPHLSYRTLPARHGRLTLIRGRVTGHGWSVAMGGPFGARKIYWRTEAPAMTGSTPYLKETLVLAAPVGTVVWVGYEPAANASPVFLGFQR